MAIERRRVAFTGRVQGVGFRVTCRSIARGFAVTGWVRNEPDGSVAMEAQGEADEVDRFLEAIRTSGTGRVEGIASEPIATAASEDGFRIVR